MTFERSPDAVRRVVDGEPLRGRHLVGADDAPNLVVEHLGCRPGKRPEPEVSEVREVLLERQVERRRALPHLERRERVDVNLRNRLLDGPHDVRVVVTCERGVDPTLEAHLRRAAIPGLLGTADDLLARDEIRRAAQIRRELPLRERAEAAAEVADVRVLDVPRHDVGDLVAADLASQRIGRRIHARRLLPARLEQPRDLVLAELRSAELERRRVAADDERHADRLAGRPRVVAREAGRV